MNLNTLYSIVLLFMCFSLDGISQDLPDKSKGTVTYSYFLNKVGLKETYVFKFNKYESVYYHHQLGSSFTTPEGYEIFTPKKFFSWYLNSKTKKVTENQKLKNDKVVFASFDAIPIEWEIQEETKVIIGYIVQKAIAKRHHFVKGKGNFEYGEAVAWFAIDLPYNSGPERFWGLPGLILEISFTQFSGIYTAEKIDFEPVGNLVPNQGIQITKEELYKDKPWLGQARDLMNKDN